MVKARTLWPGVESPPAPTGQGAEHPVYPCQSNCISSPDCHLLNDPSNKEIHYFDRNEQYTSSNKLSRTYLASRLGDPAWVKGCARKIVGALRRRNIKLARWWVRYHLSNYTDPWYLSLFDGKKGISGDTTPSYSILVEEDVARMHRVAGDAKIIFLMRNPIDQVWSMLRHEERRGVALDLDNFDKFKIRVNRQSKELRSDYLRTIDLYSKYYGSKEFLIGFYDAISRDPVGLLKSIYFHVGVDNIELGYTNINRKFNISRQVDIPETFYIYLREKYLDQIVEMSERFGSYATEWLNGIINKGVELADGTHRFSPVAHP